MARPILVDTAITLSARPYGVAISSAGVVLVTRLDAAAVARFDMASRTLVRDSIAVGGIPTGIALSTNGRTAFVASQAGTIDVVDLAKDRMVAQTHFNGAGFNVVAGPDGGRVYVGTNVNKVFVLDARTHALIDSLTAGMSPNWLTFAPNGNTLWYSDAMNGDLRHVPVPSNTPLDVATASVGSLQGIAISSDGAEGYVVSESTGKLYTFDTATGVFTDSIDVPGGSPFGLVRRPRSRFLWVTTLTGWIVVIDPQAHEVLDSVYAGGTLRRLAFDPAGRQVVIADQDDRVIFAR